MDPWRVPKREHIGANAWNGNKIGCTGRRNGTNEARWQTKRAWGRRRLQPTHRPWMGERTESSKRKNMNTCRKHRTLSQTCRSISQEDIIEAFKVEKGSIELDTSYAYELFILACSVLVLLLNLFANLHGRLTPQEVAVLDISDNAMCLVFFVDFVRNYGLNRKKRALARKHLWNTPLDKFKLAVFYTADLLSCIPSDLPLGGRFLRIFRVLKIYRLLRAAKNAKVLMFCLIKDSAIGALLGATFLSLTTVIFGALLVLRFELAAGPEALINTAERALWWSFVSISNASTVREDCPCRVPTSCPSADRVFGSLACNPCRWDTVTSSPSRPEGNSWGRV